MYYVCLDFNDTSLVGKHRWDWFSCQGCIIIDNRKAFDSVEHNILFAKLFIFSLGVKPTVVNWIADFLRGRFQRVKLNSDNFSNYEIVLSGIPQGSKEGSWLFLAMFNDLAIPAW